MRYPILCAACVAASGLVSAGTKLDTVIVSAMRTATDPARGAAGVTVIDRAAIDASNAGNLAELLRGRLGIHVRDTVGDGSQATIDMGGFGSTASSNTLIMVDGRKLNPSSDIGTLYLGAISLESVERVEIVQGSSGVLFGNQAVGGVINVITREPGRTPTAVEVGVGSFSRREVRVQTGQRLANGFGYRLNANHLDTDNYRRRSKDRRGTLAVVADYRKDDNRYAVSYDYLDERQQTPGALFLDEAAEDRRQAPFDGDYFDTHSHVIGARMQHRLSQAWAVETDIDYRTDDRDAVQSFRAFGEVALEQKRNVWDINPRFAGSWSTGLGDVRLTLGSDVQLTDYKLDSAFGVQSVDQEIKAVYGQSTVDLTSAWSISGGLRYGWVSNKIKSGATVRHIDDSIPAASASVTFRSEHGWQWFAKADQNYRFAKVDEHTNVFFDQEIGLKNQTGLTLETGLSWSKPGGYQADLRVYQLRLHDEISFDSTGFVNINIDRTRRRGLLVAGEIPIGDRWIVGGSYAWLNSEITGGPNQGNRIPLVPENRIRVFAESNITDQLLTNLEILYLSNQVYGADFANRFDKLDGYTVVNFGTRFEQGPWVLSLRVNNLLDKDYSESGDIGSDNLGSGHSQCIAGAFADDCPSINPAPERNFRLTAEYRFR